MFVILTQSFKTVKETPQRNRQHREYKKCSKKDGHLTTGMVVFSGWRVPSLSVDSVPDSGACPSPGHCGCCPSVPSGTGIKFLSFIF
jgi:hypothetical protein